MGTDEWAVDVGMAEEKTEGMYLPGSTKTYEWGWHLL